MVWRAQVENVTQRVADNTQTVVNAEGGGGTSKSHMEPRGPMFAYIAGRSWQDEVVNNCGGICKYSLPKLTNKLRLLIQNGTVQLWRHKRHFVNELAEIKP